MAVAALLLVRCVCQDGLAFLQVTPSGSAGLDRHAPPAKSLPLVGSPLLDMPATLTPSASSGPQTQASSMPMLTAFLGAALLMRRRARGAVTRFAKGKPQTTAGVRVRKPKCNALRNTSIATFEELTTRKRYMPLTFMYRRRFSRPKHKPIMMASKTARMSGHNCNTRQGAPHANRHARLYRIIDFGRTKRGVFGTIQTVEYDPYRNARICLVEYEDGEKRYILHAIGFFVGQQIISSEDAPVFVGNAMPLNNVPIGTMVHNIEMWPGRGGQLARSAGNSAIVLSRDEANVTVKLPSSEVRLLPKKCWCTIGKVGRPEAQLIKLGKAGKRRQLGWRPHVRGCAKNACDHPHGGGEGHSPVGYKHPRTKFGNCALGRRTRRAGQMSEKRILIRRKKKSGRN